MLTRVRDTVGRAATVTGATVLAGGLLTDAVTIPGVLAAVTTAGIGLAVNPGIRRSPARSTLAAVYAAPHAGCALILVGERLAPDTTVSLLVQAGAVALWTGAAWILRPGLTARGLVAEAEAQEIAAAAEELADTDTDTEVEPAPVYATPQERWWGEEIATEDGIAPGTVLLDHQRVAEQCLALVIGSARRGTPVPLPDDFAARMSALLDVPEEQIEVGPVPGRGAGVRLLVVGERPQTAEPEKTTTSDSETWAAIAATAMPGVELVDAATYTLNKELT